jgi:hypothetical protein
MLGGRVQWRDVRELSLAVAVGLSFFCLGTSVVDGKDASSAQPRVVVEMVFGRGDRDATGTEGASSLPPTVTMGPGTNAVATDVSADGLVEQLVCVCAGAGMPGWVPSYVHPPTPHAPC